MAVEVILKKPVEGLGAEADIVKVKPGYARNFLLPRDLAVVATSASKKMMEELKRHRAEREAQELNAAEEMATALKKVTITFQLESASSEKVFGSITTHDIADRLETNGIKIDRKKLVLPKPLRGLGEYEVLAHLPMNVQGKFKVVLETLVKEKAVAEELPKGRKPRKAKSTE